MLRVFFTLGSALMLIAGLPTQSAFAETPIEVLATFRVEASGAPGFQEFSATRGRIFSRPNTITI